jgi:hypothetical protein
MALFNLPNIVLPNVDLNELSSQFASQFGHDTTFLIQRITNRDVWDSEPQQFLDLKLLNMFQFDQEASEEFSFLERTYLGTPLQAAGTAGSVTSPATQTFTVTSLAHISTDMIITYPNNAKGTVTAINTSTLQVTVTPMTGGTLPAVAVGDLFSHLSNIDANRRDGFPTFFRSDYTERFNFIQKLSYAVTFTDTERWKHEKAGTIDNYVAQQKEDMMKILRTRLSNIIWNGERGEVTLANGSKEKTTGGIYPTMVAAGSPSSTTTISNIRAPFENLVLQTEFGEYGRQRFAFMHPELHLALSKEYKDDKTRYAPEDVDVTRLQLKMVDIGSSQIVLTPFTRFGDSNSFPAAFRNRIFIIDPANIKIKQLWGERSGETLDRAGGVAKTYKDTWVDTQVGTRINNPLSFATVDVV